MNSKILLLALTVALFTSCTTAYKSGQTPDDVYFSPARPQDDDENKKEDKDNKETRNDRKYRNNDDVAYEDEYLRMKVRNRSRWSELDDPYYYSRRYNSSVYNCCCFGNPWSPSTYWNNYYNPYYQNSVIINPKVSTSYNRPRTVNLNTYNNNALTNKDYTNPKVNSSNTKTSNNNNYNNSNNTYNTPRNSSTRREESGTILRDIFKGSSSGSNTNSSTNSTNSSSSSSSSSSSGSSSSSSSPAPVRRF